MLSLFDFKRFLDREGVGYDDFADYVGIHSGSDKFNFKYLYVISIDHDVCQVNLETGIFFRNLSMDMFDTINELNHTFRYYRFYIREPHHSCDEYMIVMQYDFDVNGFTTPANIMQVMYYGSQLLEQAYPKIQRVIWG